VHPAVERAQVAAAKYEHRELVVGWTTGPQPLHLVVHLIAEVHAPVRVSDA
jgi:hypothetical protein